MPDRPPGPICAENVGPGWVDEGTTCRARSAPPAPTGVNVSVLGPQDKIGEALRRSLPLLPAEARHVVEAMIEPEALAIMGGTLIVWAGSHFFGVGEIVDVALLTVGFALLGASVLTGAQALYDFATTALNAKSDADLNRAAHHFATAVTTLGVSVITALLLRSNVKAVRARKPPPPERAFLKQKGLLEVGRPLPPGVKPNIRRPRTLASGALGETDWYGNIAVVRNQSITEQRITLYHEWVHSVLSPRVAPLRHLRARLKASAYWRSALLRYLEEAMAEGWAQLRVRGLSHAISAIKFPIAPPGQGGYVTLSQLQAEGVAIGSVMLEGARFTVFLSEAEYEEP